MIYIDPMLTTTKNHLKKIDKEQRQGNLNRTLKKSSKPHTKKDKKQKKKTEENYETAQEQLTNVNKYLSIITLNVYELSVPIKRYRVDE